MKLKKFNEYIKENYENLLPADNDIEHSAKGEDLEGTEEDSIEDSDDMDGIEIEDNCVDGNCEEEIDVKGELSKLDRETLRKIASEEIDICALAKEILETDEDFDDEDGDYDEDDFGGEEDYDDYEDEDFGDNEENVRDFQLENVNFKNFKKRK